MGGSNIERTKNLHPGDHIIHIYKTEKEYRKFLAFFLNQGLERNEKIYCVVNSHSPEEVLGYLKANRVDVQYFLDRGQLAVFNFTDAYVMGGGGFDPGRISNLLRKEVEYALEEGYSALRVASEMSWALNGFPGSERLIEYEAKANLFLRGSACLALCQYDRRRFDARLLLDALSTHPIAVVGTKIYDNYYFLPPKRYIAKSLHEAILDRLINNLEERKELKEQLSKERGFSDQILQSLPAFFVAIDAEGRTRMMNETMLRKLGYTPEEVLGADYLHTFVPEKERDALAGVFRTLASSNQPTVSVNRILTKDGREITVEWHGRRVLKEDGSLDFYFGVGVDITERVMAEEALREREEMFRAIATAARDAIVILDDRGKVTYWNPAANEIFGYTAEEMLGKDLHQILAPEKHHGFYQEGYLQFRATGSGPMIGRTVELEGRRKDGSIFPFELSLSAFKRKGKWHALGVAREITERKRQEEALRESEQKYRIIFEATGTAMFLVERDATISDVNRVAEEMLGYAREEMVGKMRYMELAMPEEVNKVKDYSLKLLRGEIKGPVQYEIKARHKSGRAIPAIITVSMLPSIGRSIISLIDISKEKEREKELKERAEQLKDFLDIASHELRHPITLLKGYAITLEKHGNFLDSKAYASALQAIQDGSDRLVNVVEGLLDVSRIERGRYPIRKSEVNIRLLAEKAVEEMRTREGSRKIALDLPDDLDVAFIDPDGILRLFIILLENALKYSPSDSLIEVRGERLEGEIRFSVLDRGIGIPEEDREKIFERFYQVEDVLHHSKPGMGIGLYIAREIVEAHGGKIWYEHREGGGSVFYFTLPQ